MCEPTLVVKSDRGARATTTAAETKTIYKTDICEDGEEESDSKTYKLIMKKEINFLRQHKRKTNVKMMNNANERQVLIINSDFIIINSDFITLKLFYRYIALMVNIQACIASSNCNFIIYMIE